MSYISGIGSDKLEGLITVMSQRKTRSQREATPPSDDEEEAPGGSHDPMPAPASPHTFQTVSAGQRAHDTSRERAEANAKRKAAKAAKEAARVHPPEESVIENRGYSAPPQGGGPSDPQGSVPPGVLGPAPGVPPGVPPGSHPGGYTAEGVPKGLVRGQAGLAMIPSGLGDTVRVHAFIKKSNKVYVSSVVNPVFGRNVPFVELTGNQGDNPAFVKSAIQHQLKNDLGIIVANVMVAGGFEFDLDIVAHYCDPNGQRHLYVHIYKCDIMEKQIVNKNQIAHPVVGWQECDAMQSPRILFGPVHIRNWLVDPDDFEAQPDTVFKPDTSNGADGQRLVKRPGPIKTPDAWYGIFHKENPKNLTFADWSSHVTVATEYYGDDEDHSYLYVKALMKGNALVSTVEYELLRSAAGQPRTFRSLLEFLKPLNQKVEVKSSAVTKLENTTMKMPHTTTNYYSFKADFERNKNEGQIVDDHTLRKCWLQNIVTPLRIALYQRTDTPADMKDVNSFKPDMTPYTYMDMLAHTDQEHAKQQALHRVNVEAGTQETAGKRKTGEEDVSGLSRRQQKRAKAQLRSNDSRVFHSPFSAAERKPSAKLKEGSNGTFNDGTIKTCNTCNSPDHLMGSCSHTVKKNLFHASSSVSKPSNESSPSGRSKSALKKSKAQFAKLATLIDKIGEATPSAPAAAAQPMFQAAVAGANAPLNNLASETRTALKQMASVCRDQM